MNFKWITWCRKLSINSLRVKVNNLDPSLLMM